MTLIPYRVKILNRSNHKIVASQLVEHFWFHNWLYYLLRFTRKCPKMLKNQVATQIFIFDLVSYIDDVTNNGKLENCLTLTVSEFLRQRLRCSNLTSNYRPLGVVKFFRSKYNKNLLSVGRHFATYSFSKSVTVSEICFENCFRCLGR